MDLKPSNIGRHTDIDLFEIDTVQILRAALVGIRTSMDAESAWRVLDTTDPIIREIWNSILLRLEEARLDLNVVARSDRQRSRSSGMISDKRLFAAVQNARATIEDILAAQSIRTTLENTKFVATFPSSMRRVFRFAETVEDALLFTLAVTNKVLYGPESLSANSRQALRGVIPSQKVSPVQFSVEHGKLVVVKQPAQSGEGDASNVQHSRDALLSKGNTLVEELQRSNCDRRLLQSVAELQQSLESCENIIRLGLMNIGVEAMCNAFVAELPDAIRGIMLGHTRGIAMYVAQFPDWQKFSENAASIDLTLDDIRGVSETAKKLASDLEQHPEIADDEVPKTIKALQQLIENPALATKRAAYAVLRTIENLVAKTLEYCTDLLDKTATKTVECASGVASKTLAAMMALALAGALGLSPLTAKITDTAWVKAAAEIVEKQIEALAKK